MLGGVLISAGFALDAIFCVLVALGLLGVVLTMLVPMTRAVRELGKTRIKPASSATIQVTAVESTER